MSPPKVTRVLPASARRPPPPPPTLKLPALINKKSSKVNTHQQQEYKRSFQTPL
ncbi:hypothetical protein CCACVL1_05369 [Corchorus capsularis]|uniref:Uncharacterized protein n=1 Tax=Corchorus capsularis TaxID=210143 RepID=A0A1R3JL19_COCAP|nr:hypothetical protein CCACVL1_05369 [Corchorus capsularis]